MCLSANEPLNFSTRGSLSMFFSALRSQAEEDEEERFTLGRTVVTETSDEYSSTFNALSALGN